MSRFLFVGLLSSNQDELSSGSRQSRRQRRSQNVLRRVPQSNYGREVRATASLTVFLLSQWVLPQVAVLQSAVPRAYAIQKSPDTSPESVPQKRGTGKSGAGTRKSRAISGAELKGVAPKTPGWYVAAQSKAAKRRDNTRQGMRLLLAQNGEAKGARSPFTPPTITRITPKVGRAEAASGSPLLRGNFPGDVRASAPLSPLPFITPVRLNLSGDRVPKQAEIVALGGLAGPLSPAAPAEPEVFEEEMNTDLKKEGFAQGLKTVFPTEVEAQKLQIPALIVKAKHFDEIKGRVKKAKAQNREFALSMSKWKEGKFKVAAQELSAYAKKYPKSPWLPEALIHVANYAKSTGQGNQSEDLYRQVLKMTSDDPAAPSYNVHRKAFGRLTDLYLIEKRFSEARPMLQEIFQHATNWRHRTWGLYWLRQMDAINADPKRRLAQLDCGTRALSALLFQTGRLHQARAVLGVSPRSERGFSLAELQNLAARQKVALVGFSAQKTQLAQLPLPLILHYTDKTPSSRAKDNYGHFVVLRSYDAKQRLWRVLSPQDGVQVSLSASQIGRDWSGRGLMLAKRPVAGKIAASVVNNPPKISKASYRSPSKSIVLLSLKEMKNTYGTGFDVAGQDDNGCSANNKGPSACNSSPNPNSLADSGPPRNTPSPGSPSVSVNQVTQNIYIVDTPVWYSPSKGPTVNITLSYNSLDASNYNTLMGNKWSFGYGSYVAEMTDRVLVFMPDGKQDIYTPAESVPVTEDENGNTVSYASGTYVSPRGNYSTLSKSGNSGWILTSQGGDKAIFGIPNGIGTTIPVLLELRDRWNQSLHFAYGLVGGKVVPFTITDADGKVTRLQYDGQGHLIYAQTPDERQASFSYDANGNLIQCVDAAGQAFQYAYDDMANIVQLNTAQGPWTFAYESAAHMDRFTYHKLSITDPSQSRPESYMFRLRDYSDSTGPHISGDYTYTDHRGKITKLGVGSLSGVSSVDRHSVLTSIQTPEGQTTTRDYTGTPAQSLAPTSTSNGVVQRSISYNGQGMPTSYSSAGRTMTMTYAANGLDVTGMSVSGTGAGGTISQTLLQSATYNGAHQPTQTIDNTGRITNYTYTAWGAPLTVATTEGSGAGAVTHTVQYGYGTAPGTPGFNRLVALVQDGTLQASYTRDGSGRVASSTDAQGVTLTYRYNNLDSVTQVTYPDGTKTTTEYACCALPGMVTDRSGRRSYFDYDALKRLVRMQDADGQTLQFDYDADGNRTSLLDAKGNRTRWNYDGNNRVAQKRYADGKGEAYAYRASDGLLSASTNGRNQTTAYSYDAMQQLSAIDYPNSPDVSMQRDALGRVTSMSDGSGTTSWSYDSYGRPVSENGPWSSDTVSYGYDSLGRAAGTSVERPGGMIDTTILGYDTLGRLKSVTGNMGDFGTVGQTLYSYLGSTSQLTQVARPNGVSTNYGYESGANSLQRLTNVSNVAGTDNLSSFGYSYGTTGAPGGFKDNRVSQTKTYDSENAQSVNYGYNATSMLTGEGAPAGGSSTPVFSFSYSFDPMGNRTMVADLTNQKRTDSSYNRLNQLTGSSSYDTTPATPVLTGTTVFGYDGDGNMSAAVSKDAGGTVVAGVSYVYDDASRLVSITTATSKTEFVYDGMSRLRTSTYSTGGAGNWTVQNERRRVYKGMDVVQERDGTGAVTASLTRTGNIGGILARSTSAGHFHFGYDGGGNVTTLTNTAGAVVGSYTYDAWGNLLASSGAQAGDNPYRFSTKESVAGLYYYGYRFYATGLGRWINRDPIRESGGTGLYVAMSNDLINSVDAYGLWPQPGDPDYDPTFHPYRGGPPPTREWPTWTKPLPSGGATGADYGNYCGFSKRGPGDPLDALDAACQSHDACIAGPTEWFTPGRRETCDRKLGQDANDAFASGCDTAPNPRECRRRAREVEDWSTAWGGTWILPPMDRYGPDLDSNVPSM